MSRPLVLHLSQARFGRLEGANEAQTELDEEEWLARLEELARVTPGSSNAHLLGLYRDLYELVDGVPLDHDLPTPKEVPR